MFPLTTPAAVFFVTLSQIFLEFHIVELKIVQRYFKCFAFCRDFTVQFQVKTLFLIVYTWKHQN